MPLLAFQKVLAPVALVLCAQAPVEDDLATVERHLEYAPEDPGLLGEAALAARESGQPDKSLWYATLGLEHGAEGKNRERLLSLVEELAPADETTYLEEYTEELFQVARNCHRKKLYANAVDLLAACRDTPFEEEAGERLEKILDKDKAVTALLRSGLEVPVKATRLRLGHEEIARLNQRHSDWDDPHEVKGEYYTVRTNIGYEMAHTILNAMEQMNRNYREVFGHKERGQSMRRCIINVYKSRSEFDRHEDVGPTTGGFFRPGENSVTTYDPRSENEPLSKLWATLFHEASHQFTHAVWPNLIPGWINEGTACYFEGARLLPNGSVEFNGIPDSRLRNLVHLLDAGSPAVRDVIAYFQRGSYDGSYYPFGWGLAYFCRNYENDDSERVYLEVYEDFMETYESGGKHDVHERFVEYFVEDAEVEGVETFEDFVALWEGWIRDLHEIHFGGPEQADRLIARAEKQRANEKLEAAVESLRWALRKRPDDPAALSELGEVRAELGHEDAAMFSYRQLARLARSAEDPDAPLEGAGGRTAREVLEEARLGIEEIDRGVARALIETHEMLVESAARAARTHADEGFSRRAMHLIHTAQRMLGGDGTLARLASEIGGDLDLRRWRRLKITEGLPEWKGPSSWTAGDDALQVNTQGVELCVYQLVEPPMSYRYEATIELAEVDPSSAVGLIYGSTLETGQRLFVALTGAGVVGLVEFEEGRPKMTKVFGNRLEPETKTLDMAIEVSRRRAEFYLDGEKVGELEVHPGELRGRVGVFGQVVRASFEDLRLKH